MTPVGLLLIIALLGVVRLLFSSRAVSAMVDGAPAPGASALGASAPGTAVAVETKSGIVREYLDAFLMAGIAALFLITFVVRTFYIPSESMLPTLQVHDILLVSEFEYNFSDPHQGDVVVFKPPIAATSDFIKRVVGIPGDRIRVQDGQVYRNGVALNETYILQRPAYDLEIKNYGIYVDGVPLDAERANIPPKSRWKAADRIPPGCYLMFGDNRNDSQDSHYWGFAQPHGNFASGELKGQAAKFTGHAVFVFWPFERVRVLH